MMGALAYAIQLLSALPSLISAGVEVKGLIEKGQAAMTAMQTEKRDPTNEEWDALDAEINALRKALHEGE